MNVNRIKTLKRIKENGSMFKDINHRTGKEEKDRGGGALDYIIQWIQ